MLRDELLSYASKLTIDDIPIDGELRDVVEIIGIKNTVNLCLHFRGAPVYFPKTVERHLQRVMALDIHKGDVRETAQKCGVTISTVYHWLRGESADIKEFEQIELFTQNNEDA